MARPFRFREHAKTKQYEHHEQTFTTKERFKRCCVILSICLTKNASRFEAGDTFQFMLFLHSPDTCCFENEQVCTSRLEISNAAQSHMPIPQDSKSAMSHLLETDSVKIAFWPQAPDTLV